MASHTSAPNYSLECMFWSSWQNHKCRWFIIFLVCHALKRTQNRDSNRRHKCGPTCVKPVRSVATYPVSETLQIRRKKGLCNKNTKHPSGEAYTEKEGPYLLERVSLSRGPEHPEGPLFLRLSGMNKGGMINVCKQKKIHKLGPPPCGMK